MKRGALLALLALCSCSVTLSSCSNYKSQAECVKSEIKGDTKEALIVARQYCTELFDKIPQNGKPLSTIEVAKIDGRAGYYGNSLNLDLYNGTDKVLTNIVVGFGPKGKIDETKLYKVPIKIDPQSAKSTSVTVVAIEGDHEWFIVSADGTVVN